MIQTGMALETRLVLEDWWTEDLCELKIDHYKRVLMIIKAKRIVSNDVIGAALNL